MVIIQISNPIASYCKAVISAFRDNPFLDAFPPVSTVPQPMNTNA